MTAASPRPLVVVLTGVSGGTRLATARELAARAHTLVLAARRAADLDTLARKLDPGGTWSPTDVTDDAARWSRPPWNASGASTC